MLDYATGVCYYKTQTNGWFCATPLYIGKNISTFELGVSGNDVDQQDHPPLNRFGFYPQHSHGEQEDKSGYHTVEKHR
jgi:hypothetical protein